MSPAQPDGRDRLLDRGGQQGEELALHVLDHIVGCAGLQGRHRDPALFRGRDVDHGRRIGQRLDGRERLKPVLARHVVIERDRIDSARREARQPARAVLAVSTA